MHSVMAQPFDAPREPLGKRVWKIIRAIMQLSLPVTLTVAVLSFAFLYKDQPVTSFDFFPPNYWAWNPGYWLTVGHLLLPLAFFFVNLTNRRFGPVYAVAQVIATWVLLALLVSYILVQFGEGGGESAFPPAQVSVGFLVAFGLAQLVNVNVFDKTRGRTWWGAPLISIVWASLIYVIVFHPVANWGGGEAWMPKMVADFAIKSAIAIALLVPYHLLRKAIRPLPGYGGA